MKITRKQLYTFFIVLSILASIKMLLQNFSLDEEYQVLMSYRSLMGDRMLETIWEPHQTSSFLCTLFMLPYYKITGTLTGIVIYLRIIGTLLHLGVSCYLYRIFRHFLKSEYCFFLAMIYFNTIPKLIMLPEFGGMQVWFGTLTFLCILDAMEHITFSGKSRKAIGTSVLPSDKRDAVYCDVKLILAGIFMCLEALSYPSAVLLFFPFCCMIFCFSKAHSRKNCLFFAVTCILIGISYIGYFLIKLGGSELFLRNLNAILHSDLTHTFETGSKLQILFENLMLYIGIFAVLTGLAAGITKCVSVYLEKKDDRRTPFQTEFLQNRKISFLTILLILSNAYQLFRWIILNTGYESLQIHLAVTMCLGLWLIPLHIRNNSTFVKYMWFGTLIGILSLACVMLLTDLDLLSSVPHGMLAAFCMLALLIYVMQNQPVHLYLLLTVFGLTACIGKGYTLRGSNDYHNVLQSEGICKYGPAIGTVSTYMGAYIYNDEYLLWQEAIPEGSNVLIVTDNVQSVNTIQYTFKYANVCHYSVVDPTAYDERLLTYWSWYPEKEPDYIVIDCWFGNMFFSEDSWIVQYIENAFPYTEIIEGNYVRIYKK